MNKISLIKKIILASILLCGFFFLSKYIVDSLNVFLGFTYLLLSLSFGVVLYYLIFKHDLNMVFIFYLMIVIVFMFFRKDIVIIDKVYNFEFYLIKWLTLLDNKIVFINIIGNVIIFIPLMLFLMYYWEKAYIFNIGIAFLIIVLLEWLQAFTKKGIFDIVDLTLNIFGIMIAILINVIYKGVRKWNKNQTNRTTKKTMNQI